MVPPWSSAEAAAAPPGLPCIHLRCRCPAPTGRLHAHCTSPRAVLQPCAQASLHLTPPPGMPAAVPPGVANPIVQPTAGGLWAEAWKAAPIQLTGPCMDCLPSSPAAPRHSSCPWTAPHRALITKQQPPGTSARPRAAPGAPPTPMDQAAAHQAANVQGAQAPLAAQSEPPPRRRPPRRSCPSLVTDSSPSDCSLGTAAFLVSVGRCGCGHRGERHPLLRVRGLAVYRVAAHDDQYGGGLPGGGPAVRSRRPGVAPASPSVPVPAAGGAADGAAVGVQRHIRDTPGVAVRLPPTRLAHNPVVAGGPSPLRQAAALAQLRCNSMRCWLLVFDLAPAAVPAATLVSLCPRLLAHLSSQQQPPPRRSALHPCPIRMRIPVAGPDGGATLAGAGHHPGRCWGLCTQLCPLVQRHLWLAVPAPDPHLWGRAGYAALGFCMAHCAAAAAPGVSAGLRGYVGAGRFGGG